MEESLAPKTVLVKEVKEVLEVESVLDNTVGQIFEDQFQHMRLDWRNLVIALVRLAQADMEVDTQGDSCAGFAPTQFPI